MLLKFKGASPSTLVAVRFSSLIEEMRSKEKGEKRNASTLKI
jgi:hypothetical protein